MAQEIQAIRFDVEDIGKHVKSSKKRFSWTFGLNGRNHTIILDFSFISGKVKLIVDRKTLLETQLPTNTSFQHPFTLDGFAINILQQGQTFELRINNKVFSHLYTQAKTNTEFKNYEDQVKDIKVDQSSFQNTNKVKLNIGALDGMKKKTKNTVESQNWGNFGGSGMGIPSYFGDQQSSTSSSRSQQVPKPNLLDSDDDQPPAQKKTEQVDFFANNNQSQPSVSVSPSQQYLQQIAQQANKEDFNTMQNMFATVNIQPNQPQVPLVSSGLDLLNSASTSQVDANNFNTMQNLFATQNQGISFSNPSSINMEAPNLGTNNLPNISNSDFNTMQNLFATGQGAPINLATSNPSLQTGNVPSFPNPSEFNTMQNLFATGNQGLSVVQNSIPNTGVQVNSQNYQTASGFNTMQNLFATNSQGIPIQNIATSQPITAQGLATGNVPSFPSPSEFNTMQNLFATGNQGGITMAQLQSNPTILQNPPTSSNPTLVSQGSNFNTMQNLFATSNNQVPQNSGIQMNADLQNINIQDFNTMQNLFKTGPGVVLPPPTATTQVKKSDPLTTLLTNNQPQNIGQVPNAGMFKTYSGAKTTTTVEVNAASFGTMQKGQLGTVDFFQAQTTTQTTTQSTQAPNFSKKKQPLQQDLI